VTIPADRETAMVRRCVSAAMLATACIVLALLFTSCGGGGNTAISVGPGNAPVASFSAASLSFGNQPIGTTSSAQTATLSNTGNATLTITSISITGANASDFAQTNTCGSAVAAGANCTISLIFTPSAAGTRTASLNVTDNASGSPQVVTLTGMGTHDAILGWTASPTGGVIGYNVYRGTTSGGPYTRLNQSVITSLTYIDGDVQAGQTYYYVVTAIASNGVTESAYSDEVQATVPSP
jgi:hypothetical protein